MLLEASISSPSAPPGWTGRGDQTSPQRIKILCFVPQLGGGGAEMHLLRLLTHFDRTKFQPLLAVARPGGSYESRLPADLIARRCGWSRVPSSTLRMQTSIPALRRLLAAERPEVIISFLDHTTAATSAALESLPHPRPVFIAAIQNNLEKTLAHLPRWTRAWLPRAIVSAYARADQVIALSTGVAEGLSQLIPETRGRISVIHNAGYDQQVQALASEEPVLPTPKGPWFLGCGRLTAQKDFSTLIRAFARLQHECGAALWILGEGGLRGKLEREIAALGLGSRVRLPGFVKNPFAFMARASAFVLSSQWEGFGNVVTEAMACGTPVISTDCPHGPREILEDGKWGSLVPVANVDALADAMRAALANPEQQQARATAARSHVTRFEAGRITRQYEQAILSALSQRQETSKQP